MASERRVSAQLRENEEEPDAHPDEHEDKQNPKKERCLAYRQPRKFAGLHEEPSPAGQAMTVDSYDLAGDRLSGVRRDATPCIAVGRGAASWLVGLPSRHEERVPGSRHSDTAPAGGTS